MISRIYIIPKGKDSREKLRLKFWAGMGLLGKLKSVSIVDSYLIDSDLDKDSILKSAQMLTNTKLEHFSINEIPETKNFQFAVEIGFLPGVTDNVASTTKETIMDLLHLDKNLNLKVYTSKIYIISGSIKLEDVKKDKHRDNILESQGWNILRYTTDDIKYKIDLYPKIRTQS